MRWIRFTRNHRLSGFLCFFWTRNLVRSIEIQERQLLSPVACSTSKVIETQFSREKCCLCQSYSQTYRPSDSSASRIFFTLVALLSFPSISSSSLSPTSSLDRRLHCRFSREFIIYTVESTSGRVVLRRKRSQHRSTRVARVL